MNVLDPPSVVPTANRSRLEEHPLVVVCSADNGFAMPLAVTLYSALSNYRGSPTLRVYIIDGGIRAANRGRVDRILERLGAVAEWLEPDWQPVRHLPISEQYPASTYLRLLIPTFLPKSLEKAIYLDSDLIVHGNIADLWDVDLDRKALLAAQDKGVPTVGAQFGLANYSELGLDPSAMYFNSGVLVFDLRAWRERALAERVLKYVAAHPNEIWFGEQHALNAILAGDWGALEAKWNQQVWAWEEHDAGEYPPGILHFVSTSKPWTPTGAHWTNFLFDRYLKQSGWYSTAEWWKYYIPLLVQRQWVIYLRSRRAPLEQKLEQIET